MTGDETAELKAVIREGHELLKDLRQTLAAVEVAKAQSLSEVQDLFDATVAQHVDAKLTAMLKELEAFTQRETREIHKHFKEIADILLGKSRQRLAGAQVDLETTAKMLSNPSNVKVLTDDGVDLGPLVKSGMVKPPRPKGKK